MGILLLLFVLAVMSPEGLAAFVLGTAYVKARDDPETG